MVISHVDAIFLCSICGVLFEISSFSCILYMLKESRRIMTHTILVNVCFSPWLAI